MVHATFIFKKKACGQPAPALRSALSPQGILLLLISLPAPHSQSLQALLNLHKLLCYMDATFWSSWEQGVALTWRNKAHLWLLTQARKDSASQGMVRSWPSLPSFLILPYSAALSRLSCSEAWRPYQTVLCSCQCWFSSEQAKGPLGISSFCGW